MALGVGMAVAEICESPRISARSIHHFGTPAHYGRFHGPSEDPRETESRHRDPATSLAPRRTSGGGRRARRLRQGRWSVGRPHARHATPRRNTSSAATSRFAGVTDASTNRPRRRCTWTRHTMMYRDITGCEAIMDQNEAWLVTDIDGGDHEGRTERLAELIPTMACLASAVRRRSGSSRTSRPPGSTDASRAQS